MLITSSTFDNAIKSNGRELYVRSTIGAKIFDYSNIVSFTVEESVANEELQLGVAACSSLELEVNNQDGYLNSVVFENAQVNLEAGIKTSAGVEYISLGKFNIDKSEKKSKSILLKGFDSMIKTEIPFVDSLTYPTTLAQIAQVACTQVGLTLVSTTFNNSNYVVSSKFYSEGATCRDVLAYVAGASGGFARCTRDGKIEIVWVTNTTVNIQPENWINLSMKELKAGPINRLIVSKNDGVVTGDHFSIEDNQSITTNGEYSVIIRDNPLLIDNMEGALNPIFNQINGLAFHPYSMTWQGNPALQPLDKIKVTNETGTVFDTLITSQKLIYAGGLKCEMKCAGKSITARTYKREGPINKRIKYAEITLDKQAAEIALKASSEEVEGLNQRLNKAEISLQPENIALKVSYSDAYSKLNKKEAFYSISVIRNGLSISPLEAFNFSNGKVYASHELVVLNSGIVNERSYVPDLSIVNNNVYIYSPITETIDDIDERLAEAEIKITQDAIISTVRNSTEYNQDVNNLSDAIAVAQSTANSKASPSYVDSKASAAETNAKAYADAVAQAEADLAEIQAKAYADGKVTAEEQARINDAQAKLSEAKAYAETKAQEAKDAANLYSDSKLNNFVTTIYNSKVIDLQNQIDGNITTWFYDGAPTLSNSPASSWVSNGTKDIHLGDLYYDNLTGYAYRFIKSGSTYSWGKITDTDVTKALADASKAQDTADKKRRVFVVQPTAPYDIGDLWSQGTTGDLMKCKVAKLQGQSYSASDWEKASKYTDDTKANEVAANLATTNSNIDILVNRVTNAEQKITPEAITQTVTESNTYKSYSLVPKKNNMAASRNGLSLNPLQGYNFTSGTPFNANELVMIDFGLVNLVYTADLQIIGKEVITFDKASDRIETAESKIEQTATSISLIVKEDGTINGDALTAAINVSASKIEMSALNIDFSGLVTFTALSAEGGTIINGKNIITSSISFNSLSDKPFIPTQYSDAQALQAWINSGYKTYIDSTGAYIGSIKANQLLIGGVNGSISFNDLINKPFIPSSAADVGAIPSTYINASGIWTGQVYANNINVSNGKITANMIDVDILYSGINKVSSYVQFGGDLNAIYAVSGTKILSLYSNYGVNIDSNIATVKGETIATRTWVQAQSSIAKFA